MDVHGLVVFLPCLLVHEARTKTLDLHTCLGFLLNVLHKHTLRSDWSEKVKNNDYSRTYLRTDNFRSDVEVPDGIESHGDLFFWPFTLFVTSITWLMTRLFLRSTFSRSRLLLSSTREPMSIFINSLTLSIAL